MHFSISKLYMFFPPAFCVRLINRMQSGMIANSSFFEYAKINL
nr:MAG TPA_asm: hypothetical protein [Bacteriophage sp.]